MADDEMYLTRGVQLQCDQGSHPRRLNIPTDKGEVAITSDKYKHPFVFEDDCKVGPNQNIDQYGYGICKILTQLEQATYQGKAAAMSPNWRIYKKKNDKGAEITVEGTMCKPAICGKWQNTKTDAYSSKSGDKKMVTNNSFLQCTMGGTITPVDKQKSGIEYSGDQDS